MLPGQLAREDSEPLLDDSSAAEGVETESAAGGQEPEAISFCRALQIPV